jgi:hypothetical protein
MPRSHLRLPMRVLLWLLRNAGVSTTSGRGALALQLHLGRQRDGRERWRQCERLLCVGR